MELGGSVDFKMLLATVHGHDPIVQLCQDVLSKVGPLYCIHLSILIASREVVRWLLQIFLFVSSQDTLSEFHDSFVDHFCTLPLVNIV